MTFAYHKPPTLPEALALVYSNPSKFPVLAGGTDIIVQWKSGIINPSGIIDISAVDELAVIIEKEDSVEIGALATHAQIAANKIVGRHLPVLSDACKSIGALQIQNRGTIGGNIMNASPAGDTLPVLAAFDAEILAQDLTGERWIPVRSFYTGYRKTAIKSTELLTRIRFPKQRKEENSRFYKIGTRRAQAISKVVMCVRGTIDHGGIKEIAIAVGSVAPTVVRMTGTEVLLKGRVINAALVDNARRSIEDEVHPIDDVRSTADYRRHICGALLAQFLDEAS